MITQLLQVAFAGATNGAVSITTLDVVKRKFKPEDHLRGLLEPIRSEIISGRIRRLQETLF